MANAPWLTYNTAKMKNLVLEGALVAVGCQFFVIASPFASCHSEPKAKNLTSAQGRLRRGNLVVSRNFERVEATS
jgi:hypothetical protein